MEYAVQIISALAWPLTVIIVSIMFRHEAKQIVARLSSLSYGEVKAEFKHDLMKIENAVDALDIGTANSGPQEQQNGESLSSYERLLRIAEISPRAAIMEAWRDIEVTTKKVTDAYGISVGGQIAGVKAIRELVRRGLLPESVVPIYERMRRLRSRAAHAADFAIDPEEAERYIDTAYKFHNTLLFLLDQSDKQKSAT